MILSDFISPDVMVARSVNLERDMGDEVPLRHYYLTGKGLEILSRFVAALSGERVSAWSLTGPYGMGKSSFANYLLALCGPQSEKETRIARNMLEERDIALASEFCHLLGNHSAEAVGLFRVAVTSSFESINRTLAKGLRRALLHSKESHQSIHPEIAQLIHRAESLSSQAIPETMQLVELFRAAGRIHGVPVIIVIDEFGKSLEYMARFPAQGDLFILQALAESESVYIWVCLHQAFEEYTSRLSARQLQEWGKIQGRFEDVSFVEPKHEMIRFICESLSLRRDNPSLNKVIRSWAEDFQSGLERVDLPELRDFDVDTIERLYPLHPLAAVALPELCVRFAQNDRTLFAFLCSGEPNALPAFLSTQSVDAECNHVPTFGLELLYDYFLTSSTTALMNRPESQRWIEIHDIIERSRNIDPFHHRVLKVIGLLNLISGPSRFRSSESLVAFAFFRPHSNGHTTGNHLQKAIEANIQKGVLIYREYADEYRLWEGTDFDIPAAIRERKAILGTQSLQEVLEDTLPLTPLTASKHSYETGTLRHFERCWHSLSQGSLDVQKVSSNESDGLVFYCFGNEQQPPSFPSKTEGGLPIVVGYAACEDQIRDLVLDAAAAKAVLRDSPELARDGVARKEAKFRAYMAEERLRGYLAELFTPGNSEVSWTAMKKFQELTSPKDLSRLLSLCCEDSFSKCPVIRNELINRNRLSSAAARARRELMEAMVSNEGLANLGLEGTGPEVAIYRTMLRAESIHRCNEDGAWEFFAPGPGSSYYPAWHALGEAMEEAGDKDIPVLDLIRLLRCPPFRLKEGPIPILICLFLIINSDELALYQDGAFVPRLGPEEMELMTKRPEYFAVKRFALGDIRDQVFQLYVSLLNAQSVSDSRQVRNRSLINVVGPLVQFVKTLQPYVLQTKSLSKGAQNLRHVLQQARDPVDLLFADIPKAVDVQSFDETGSFPADALDTFRERFIQALLELKDAYPKLLENIRQVILRVFGGTCIGDLKQLRAQLRRRASHVLNKCGDRDLKPFLAAMVNFSGSDQEWLVSLATIATQRPVDAWREADLHGFPVRLHDLAGRFSALETLVSKAEGTFPSADETTEPRMVSLTRADGRTSSSLIWINKANTQNAKATISKIISETGNDKSKLEAIFLLLGEHLLSEGPEAAKEGDNA